MKTITYFIICLIVIYQSQQACTIFTANEGDSVVLVGNNEDWFGEPGQMWFIPATDTSLGIIAWGLVNDGYDGIEGGMNEAGLFYDANAVFSDDPPTTDPDKEDFNGDHLFYIMRNFTTVEEVLAYLKNHNLDCPLLNQGQMVFADSTGNSAIIEKKAVIKKKGYYQVSTNFYQSKITDPLSEPETYDRYFTADSIFKENKDNINIELMRDICEATSCSNFESDGNDIQLNATIYSNICDLKNKKIYLYYMRDYESPLVFDFKNDLKDNEWILDLYSHYQEHYPGKNLYKGVWRSVGYGKTIIIENFEATTMENPFGNDQLLGVIHESTSVSMLQSGFFTIMDNIIHMIEDESIGPESGTIERIKSTSLKINLYDGTEMIFKPFTIKTTDEAWELANLISLPTDDPLSNYKVFWHTIHENFSFFDISETDWLNRYQKDSSAIDSKTSPYELFHIMANSFSLLKDGHGSLYGELPDGAEMTATSRETLHSIWISENIPAFFQIINEMSTTGLNSDDSQNIHYGTLPDSILYINILQLEGYSESGSVQDDLQAFNQIIDEILSRCKYEGIIIDARWNSGGWDRLANSLASRFINRDVPVYSKQVKTGPGSDDFSPLKEIIIHPSSNPITHIPVCILTSELTASAADVLAMTMKHPAFENVSIIGEATDGSFSNCWKTFLPNGWVLEFSNERYLDHEGINHELQGIDPHFEIIQSRDSLEKEGSDNVLNEALRRIGNDNTSINQTVHDFSNSIRLFSNYPNPFTGETRFSFILNKTSHVNLSVYNILGEKVHELIDNKLTKGHHDITFNNPGLGAGLYFYSLKTPEKRTTRKMVILP